MSPVVEKRSREFSFDSPDLWSGQAEPLPPEDPYTATLLQSLPPEVARTFTSEQIAALRQVLLQRNGRTGHLIDIRGILPLFFTQYYFVFLFGKDRRQETQEVLMERRQAVREGTSRLFLTTLLSLFLFVFLGFLFAMLYGIKSALGINLFPNFHLPDLFKR